MDIYRPIKNDVRKHLVESGRKDLSLKSSRIIDLYIKYLLQALFENGEVRIRHRHFRARLYVSVKPMAYITSTMYRNMLISPLNNNYLFEIKIDFPKLSKLYKFTFKSMSKLKYMFKKYTLENSRVYKLINDYEKSIL